MRFWIQGIGVILLTAASWVQAASIVVFGDSISAAYGLEVEQGWVSLLEKRLQKSAGGPYKVFNASVSGETTSGGLSRLPAVLTKYQPDILILELGANDGLRGQPPALMQKNLIRMVSTAQAAGAQVVLLGMKIPPNYGRGYTQAFESVFSKVAEQHQLPLVPFFLQGVGGNPAMMQRDGLHPTAEAQSRLLENAWPVVQKALQQAR